MTSLETCGAKSKEGRVWQMQLVGPAVAVMNCATLGNSSASLSLGFLRVLSLRTADSKG